MNHVLPDSVRQRQQANKKVQLIYAFNGTGKIRLSCAFKQLVAFKSSGNTPTQEASSRNKILYYNAFTEDLFYWDNGLSQDADPRLNIQPSSYTSWLLTLLKDLGQDGNIVRYFQYYTHDKLTPHFSADFAEVRFFIESSDNAGASSIKISKAEESTFIWSVFYTLLDQAITMLNAAEATERETSQFDQLQYIFIDKPVFSLDENQLIKLAVDWVAPIKASPKQLQFIITTHSALFYNILFNELNKKTCYLLRRLDDGTFHLEEKSADANPCFSYHLYLKKIPKTAIAHNQVERFERYHFVLIRNLYKKTASFLGDQQAYLSRIIPFTSPSSLFYETPAQPQEAEKQTVKFLLNHLPNHYPFNQGKKQNELRQ